MLKLIDEHRRTLLQQPESGMGYQVVEVTTHDFKRHRGVAYNGELLLYEEEPRTDLRTLTLPDLLKKARSSAGEIRSIQVLPRTGIVSLSKDVRAAKGTPAKDAPVGKTKADEVFKRFSAFQNDVRVQADGSLSAGSYATTEEDAKNVKTGKDAAARYALPNPKPASWRFTIKPDKDTDIQRGVVEPANDQSGGGAEVILTKGTQANTVTGPHKMPDE